MPAKGRLYRSDYAALRRSTVRMLQHLGYRVLVAADGAETRELLRHNVAEISLVLLDANMPHMGGSEAFAAIRAVAPDLRVVLTSGYELGQIDPALRAQVDGFLAKPYTFHQLREALKVTPSRPAAVGGSHGAALDLEQVAAPLALCDGDGRLVAGTPAARELLAACGAEEGRVPEALWRELSAVPCGEAVTWRPEGALCLGCTRYAVGDQQMLVLMREVSGKQRVLSQKMHQTRLDATGSLVAAMLSFQVGASIAKQLMPVVGAPATTAPPIQPRTSRKRKRRSSIRVPGPKMALAPALKR